MLMEKAIILVFSLLFVQQSYAAELHTISDSSFLRDGDTLVSATKIFELGFFKPGSSENRYLGIWYKNISDRTVVWVANRDHPLPGASRLVLKIANRGTLGLFNDDIMIWSSNTTTSGNTTTKLQDNGNLVVMDQDKKVIWQSFDYPTDTILPGMKIGKDYLRNKEWYASSWKNSQDPAPGEWTDGADISGYPQNKLKQEGIVKFRGIPWRNYRRRWVSPSGEDVIVASNMTINDNEVSITYNIENSSLLRRDVLSSSGRINGWVLAEVSRGWQLIWSFPNDDCDTYNICNAYGTCNMRMTEYSCTCLDEKRFMPKNQTAWDITDWSGGCIRRTPLECKDGLEKFIKYSNVRLPDTENTWFNMNMSMEECETKCLQNCTCTAYANPDNNGRVCLLWFGDLIDIQVLPERSGAPDIFVRMASSELDSQSNSKKKQGGINIKVILLVIFLGVGLTGGLIISAWLCYARRKKNHAEPTREGEILMAFNTQQEDMEQPLFRFSSIANATNNFSPYNKLGEGGFGPVYKGMLEGGKEIAVKRLSKNSNQGLEEFKNEVTCISKLQHRNLVKLLGCCIEGDEKLLVYEYMPNKSLDSFIFDKTQRALLDWKKRFNIIKGIAQGLVYLHRDSRLRIIHRDLKASNILLDKNMNPKISDFGLARTFGGNETHANTDRVVGTYGYISPEYAQEGLFSLKSDVYSFGVLVLEIVSGKRNRGFVRADNDYNFLEHVWSLYNKDMSIELLDSSCVESCDPPEVIRSINVGLLCVQHNATDRPNMSSVILMLGNEGELPQPKQPSLFFMENQLNVANFSSSTYTGGSTNITEMYPR